MRSAMVVVEVVVVVVEAVVQAWLPMASDQGSDRRLIYIHLNDCWIPMSRPSPGERRSNGGLDAAIRVPAAEGLR